MSNTPILPIPVNGAGPLDGHTADDGDLIPTDDPHLDDGETNDDQDTVEQDVRDANAVNDKLDK